MRLPYSVTLGSILCCLAHSAMAAPAIAAGGSHVAAVDRDGTVRTWGNDAQGQLSYRALGQPTPGPVPGLAAVSALAAGTFHSLALLADGTVMGWGYNISGNVGDGTFFERNRPTATRMGGFVTIAAGGHQSFGIKADKSLWGWGYNNRGQLGDGTREVRLQPVPVSSLSGVSAVATTWSHTIALKDDGTVWTWGGNSFGQLGSGPGADRDLPGPVASLSNVIAIAAPTDGDVSAALRADGTVWTWGYNGSGQLGDGTTAQRSTPVMVTGLTNVVAIAVGFQHMLALRGDGTVWSWGSNYEGQLGTGNRADRFVAGPVPGLAGIVRIAAGRYHNLAVGGDGSLWAWGANWYGQLGDGSTSSRLSPVQVGAPGSTQRVAAGGDHTLALRADGTVSTWGSRLYGLAGDGAPITRSVPGAVSGLAGVSALGAGQEFTLAVMVDGTLRAWGSNVTGQLGDGTYVTRSNPQPVPGLAGIVEATGGAGHTLARSANGTLYAWGYNTDGELGDGTTSWRTTPSAMPGLSVKSIAAGYQHSAVVRTDGTVWTWGLNDYGQLGDGTTTTRLTPTQVSGLSNVNAVTSRGWTSLALRADGTVWAWGRNNYGQVGDGTTIDRTTPAQVVGLTAVTAVTNAFIRSYALRQDGTVWAWGAGPLGDGTYGGSPVPRIVSGLDNVVAIAANGYYVVALRADGTVYGWADNSYAQLGDGTYTVRTRPAAVLAEGGAGALDAGNWFLRLDPLAAAAVPAAFTPRALALTSAAGAGDSLALESRVKYRSADFGRAVRQFVVALVPPAFFDVVGTAPGSLSSRQLRERSGETLVLAQLTPAGWTNVDGQLIAFSHAVASAAGTSTRILDRIDTTRIPGARFCIGYGDSAESLLGAGALQDVLSLEGAVASASGLPCVLSGVYMDGPATSRSGTPTTFRAMVVGLSPTGSVQFHDGRVPYLSPVILSVANEAVATATLTTSSLPVGPHSIAAGYSGDGQNPAVDFSSVLPIRHEVAAAQSATTTEISVPASSAFGAEVVMSARVTGDRPSGTVQFRDGANPIGAAEPVIGGQAYARVTGLALGSHSVTAMYSGDANNTGSVSPPASHFVDSSPQARVTLASSRNPSLTGEPVELSATVQGSSPGGTVTFFDGPRAVGTIPLGGNTATLTLAALDPGLHVLTARYDGDASNRAATSAAVFQQVELALAPAALEFPPRSNVVPGALVVSAAVTYAGPPATISVALGEYSLGCNGSFTATAGTIGTGQSVCVHHVASSAYSTLTLTTLTIGSVASVFRSATQPAGFGPAVAALVDHYYRSTLGRSPDPGGQAYWEAEAARLVALEASVLEAFFAMSMQFFGSPEYTSGSPSDAEFVGDLYRTFYDRIGDAGGVAYWTGEITAGMPREVALASFMFSPEFGAFSGNRFGPLAARPEVDAVMDFYRGLLARLPDSGGFLYWLGRFRGAQCQGPAAVVSEVEAISSAFLASAEYLGRNRNNAQFVGDLYNAFLRRGGDRPGVLYWIGQLDSGQRTRAGLRQAFVASPEFSARVNAIIARGCYAR